MVGLLVLLVSSLFGVGALPFVATWKTTLPNEEITLHQISAQSTVTINWGDNANEETILVGNSGSFSHNYSSPGLYNVSMNGRFLVRHASGLSSVKLVDVVSWGDGFVMDQSSLNLFDGCSNLRVLSAPPNTQPVFLPGASLEAMFAQSSFNSSLDWDLTNVTSLVRMFESTPLNQPITFRNTQGVTSITRMFSQTAFNQPFHFDASSLIDASMLFYLADDFNQVVNLTNSSQLNDTNSMFASASKFNQPLTFNTASVTNMAGMFYQASKFNQPVNFNVSQVTNMNLMFYFTPEFNQPINFHSSAKLTTADSMFDTSYRLNQPVTLNTTSVTSMALMFRYCLGFSSTVNFTSTANVRNMHLMFANTTNFTQDLSGWDTSQVTNCSHFCPSCGLPSFSRCVPCSPCPPTRAPTTPAPSTAAPSTVAPSTVAPSTVAPSSTPMTSGAVAWTEPLLSLRAVVVVVVFVTLSFGVVN